MWVIFFSRLRWAEPETDPRTLIFLWYQVGNSTCSWVFGKAGMLEACLYIPSTFASRPLVQYYLFVDAPSSQAQVAGTIWTQASFLPTSWVGAQKQLSATFVHPKNPRLRWSIRRMLQSPKVGALEPWNFMTFHLLGIIDHPNWLIWKNHPNWRTHIFRELGLNHQPEFGCWTPPLRRLFAMFGGCSHKGMKG